PSTVRAGVEPRVDKLVEELTRVAEDARRIDARGVSHLDRRKVIIFSAFSDTIIAIHDAVVAAISVAPPGSPLADYKGRVAPPIMGAFAKVLERRGGGRGD